MDELTVKQQTTTLEQQAQAYAISTNEDYSEAANFLKRVKGARKQVEDYWEEPIKKAFEAHRALTAKRKQMTDTCDSAERVMKRKMLEYDRKIEAERRAAEAAARKAQQEESDRLLAEAAKAEKSGNTMQATVNMAMAEQIESVTPTVQVSKPQVQGISTKKIWKVKITDERAVPNYANGICIRPVDERAIMQLHRLNPNIEIAGVSFYQENTLAVR